MIRSYLLVNLTSWDYLPTMERWLYKDHAPEILSQIAPILHRYTTYRSVPAPTGAEAYGYYNWRMTEHWWAVSPYSDTVTQHDTAFSETWPVEYPKAVGIPEGEASRGKKWMGKAPVFIFVTPRPSEDFFGRGLRYQDSQVLRWVTIHKYPEGVSKEEGDEWYTKVHAPEVCKMPGLKRYFSFAAVEPSSKVGPFVRVSELWFENHSAWKNAIIDNPPPMTKPTWATHNQYPFMKPDEDFVSTFLLERPECDFLRDYRGYNTTA